MANISSTARSTQNSPAIPTPPLAMFAFCDSAIRVPGAAAFLLFITLVGWAQELDVRVDHADAQYQAGQTATFSVSLSDADSAGVSNADYVLKKGGYTEIARGTVALPNGTFQGSLSEPGTLLAEVKAKVAGKDVRGLAGAAFSPERIQRSA